MRQCPPNAFTWWRLVHVRAADRTKVPHRDKRSDKNV